MATLVFALGKALALTAIVLIVVRVLVLVRVWRLVGSLHKVGAVVSGGGAALIVAVLTLLRCVRLTYLG